MKLCSITPLKNTNLMYENDYVMLLAHLSKIDENYADYARVNSECYKIMDNSIIELGEAFTMEDLVNEAFKCYADEIILPDVFQNGPETVKKVKESIQWLKDKGYLGQFKLMAVCHGNNDNELLSTYCELNNIPEIDVIGFPKVLSTWIPNRAKYVNRLVKNCKKEIHLLGCWYTLDEVKDLKLENIRTIDTCLPALLSIYNMNAWDDRQGKKIDLETAEVNLKRYYDIMSEIEQHIL